MSNTNIRLAARGAGIPLWRVAQTMGVSEATFTRKMRVEMLPDEAQRILSIIDQLKESDAE